MMSFKNEWFRPQRALRGYIDQSFEVVAVAVAKIHDAVGLRLVVQVITAPAHLAFLVAPLHAGVHIPGLPKACGGFADQVRAGLCDRAGREVDLLVGEVLHLAKAHPRLLDTAAGQEKTAGDSGGKLVGITHAVGAGKSVLTKEVVEAGSRERGIEHRQAVLVLVGDIDVVDAWLQRLGVGLATKPPLAFENEPAVETADRQGAIATYS